MRLIPLVLAALAMGAPAAAQEQPPPQLPRPEVKVAVTAAEPSVERAESSVAQHVSDRLAHALPLQTRNFLYLASLAAGFTGDPAFPNPQGQTYWSNNILVDGASHFSKWRSAARAFNAGYGLESIRDVQVLTNRFSAEFGDALASVTRGNTRAGTDRWHGSTLLFWQDGAMNAAPVFAAGRLTGGSQQYGATIGGPLVASRTFVFGSYEGRRSRSDNPVVSPASPAHLVPDKEDEHLPFVRVDHQLGPSHLMTARYNGQTFHRHHEFGGLALPGTGMDLSTNVHTVFVTAASVLSRDLLNQARVQFARYVDRRRDLQQSVLVSRAGYSLEGGSLSTAGFGADPEDTWEAANTLSYWRGPHAIKVGAGLLHVRAHNTLQTYGYGAYFFGGSPDQFPQPYLFMQGLATTAASSTSDPRSTSTFGFFQDDWKITSRLVLNLGVRYDLEKVSHVRGFAAPADTNNIQPRIGAAWEPFAHTTVRGGAGLYTQQHLLYYINRVGLEGEEGVALVALSPDSPLFPRFPAALASLAPGAMLPPRDMHLVGTSFNNPYSIQASAGVERAFPRGWIVAADYVYLRGRDLMSLTDANAPVSNVKPDQRSVAEADATRALVPVPNGYRKIITLGNLGQSWYHALQLKAEHSTGRLQTVGSYTLARAEDMANYQLPEDSRNLAAERARANADIRHNAAIGMTFDLPGGQALLRDWSLAAIGTFRSNRPYDVTWGDDRNGTTQSDARPGDRNTGRTAAYRNVDLSLTRRFHAGARTIDGRLEAFNVFNTTNFDQYVGTLLSPLYGRAVSAFPKRQLQLAAIVRF